MMSNLSISKWLNAEQCKKELQHTRKSEELFKLSNVVRKTITRRAVKNYEFNKLYHDSY
jgi:ribosomal protein L10